MVISFNCCGFKCGDRELDMWIIPLYPAGCTVTLTPTQSDSVLTEVYASFIDFLPVYLYTETITRVRHNLHRNDLMILIMVLGMSGAATSLHSVVRIWSRSDVLAIKVSLIWHKPRLVDHIMFTECPHFLQWITLYLGQGFEPLRGKLWLTERVLGAMSIVRRQLNSVGIYNLIHVSGEQFRNTQT